MLDTNIQVIKGSSTNNIPMNISAVSGSLQKTYLKSFFVYCQYGSPLIKMLLCANPYIEKGYRETEPVYVLQIMNSNDNYVVIEVIRQSDLDS